MGQNESAVWYEEEWNAKDKTGIKKEGEGAFLGKTAAKRAHR